MKLRGSDEKIKLAHWLEDGARSGAMGTMIESPHAFSKRESYERTGHIHKQEVTDYGSKTLATVGVVMGSMAFGGMIIGVLLYAILAPQIIHSTVEAGSAEALVIAKEARTHARVALDDVQRLRESLNVKKEH